MNFHDNDELKPQWYFSSHGHFFNHKDKFSKNDEFHHNVELSSK